MLKKVLFASLVLLNANSAFAKPTIEGLQGDRCEEIAASFINSLAIARYYEPKAITVDVTETFERTYSIKFDYKMKNWEGKDVIENFELVLDNDSASTCLFDRIENVTKD